MLHSMKTDSVKYVIDS